MLIYTSKTRGRAREMTEITELKLYKDLRNILYECYLFLIYNFYLREVKHIGRFKDREDSGKDEEEIYNLQRALLISIAASFHH